MRCLAVCQDELVIRMLDTILLPGFEVEFVIEQHSLARRLHDAGVHVVAGNPRRTDTFVKADLGPSTCVIVEDNGRRSLTKILEAIRDAGGALVYVLGVGTAANGPREEDVHTEFPDVTYLAMSELFGGPLLTEFGRSLTRARVQQYQRYFADADRERAGAPQRAAAHEDDRHHRRHPGRHASGERPDAEPARPPRGSRDG